ncbi:MAG TPA: cation transporter [Patescibacteria group bacterium]|nr:cation transporter [Patescibacteria group bacterium]
MAQAHGPAGATIGERTGRPRLLARALRLGYLTVGWNVAEGVIAIAAALAAGSVALLGFGIDSFVESASGSVLIWRLHAERRATDAERIEQVERLAQWLVAASLVLLAAFIAWNSLTAIIAGERPEPSLVGIVLAAVSLVMMWWLARQKRRVGIALGSRAMTADAFQTDACFWLSLFLLVGVGANALFGFWWADPLAALGMTFFIGREAVDAWRGEDDD